jgi:membrane protease YdiL (CAAX protease family)
VAERGDKKMATTTATLSRTTTTTGTRSIFPLVAFIALAYALSWLILVPAGLGLLPDSAGILAWLAPFGPAMAAFVVTALTGGRPAVGQLLRRMVQWRVGIHWYLLILFGVPLVELLGAFAVLGSLPLDDLAKNWPLIFTSYLPQVLVAVVVIGLAEETGWRGFALPRLQDRRGPLVGTAVLAVVWALWHLPNLLFGGWTGASYTLWLVGTLAVAFVYTWVFNNTGGSILIAALLHAAINMSSGLVLDLFPGMEDAFGVQLYGAVAIACVIVALVLVAATRGRLGYRVERVPLEVSTRS